MKTFKVVSNVCLVFLALISGFLSLGYVYYHFFVNDITIGVNYLDNQVGLDIENKIKTEDISEEEKQQLEDRYFIEVNYYSNSKDNGFELQELKLNYFTDYQLLSTGYRSTGMQYLGNYQGTPLSTWDGKSEKKFQLFGDKNRYYGRSTENVNYANEYVDSSFYYYDSINGISFNGITNNNGNIATALKRSTSFIVKIAGRPFEIRLDKYFDKDVGDVRNFAGIGWKVGEKYNRYYYTYGSLFQSCLQATKIQSAGDGIFYVTVDLSNLFSVREFDQETGKYKADDVTDIIKTYSVMKFTYHENGARNSTQSMFGIIANSSKYDIENSNIDTTYWQERMLYTLDEDDFSYRYSDVYNGYFISLNMDTKKLFSNMPRAKVNVNIDLQSQYLLSHNINIVGIDYNGFENFEIDTLSITGGEQTFYILEKSLFDSKLQTLKHSNNINLNIAENSINNEYVEVVV